MQEELRNEKGQTLREFLDAYDPSKWDRPSVTVDMVVLTETDEVLLIRRKNHPNIGRWALPGGFMDPGEPLYRSAARELEEETGLKNVPLHSLGMFAEPSRDPRTRVITGAFYTLAKREELHFAAGDDAADAALYQITAVPMGRVGIPAQRDRYPEVNLPCTACGEPAGTCGRGWRVHLDGFRRDGAKADLAFDAAVNDAGVAVLLGPVEGYGQIAGDHGLILFEALRKARRCGVEG